MNFITETISAVTGLIREPLVEWQKRKTLKVEQEAQALDREHEINLKKLDIGSELAKQGIQAEINWDAKAQENMQHSWKDEYLLILFSLPLVGCFIPAYQDDVLRGFKILESTPPWYILSILGMVAGAWGLRWLISRAKRVRDAT